MALKLKDFKTLKKNLDVLSTRRKIIEAEKKLKKNIREEKAKISEARFGGLKRFLKSSGKKIRGLEKGIPTAKSVKSQFKPKKPKRPKKPKEMKPINFI